MPKNIGNKNKPPTAEDMEKSFAEDVRFKSYKNDGKGFDELNEGEKIVGIFLTVRDQEIKDRRTKARKTIRVYSIRNNEGAILRIGGRSLLDRIFDDIMDENGGYEVENNRYRGPGIDYIQNRAVKIVRGENGKTGEGNPMGTYEIMVEEE